MPTTMQGGAGDGSALPDRQVPQLIQAIAGLSVQTGLSWEQAIQQRPDQAPTIPAESWRPPGHG
jgi:hypothetical protein